MESTTSGDQAKAPLFSLKGGQNRHLHRHTYTEAGRRVDGEVKGALQAADDDEGEDLVEEPEVEAQPVQPPPKSGDAAVASGVATAAGSGNAAIVAAKGAIAARRQVAGVPCSDASVCAAAAAGIWVGLAAAARSAATRRDVPNSVSCAASAGAGWGVAVAAAAAAVLLALPEAARFVSAGSLGNGRDLCLSSS